MKILTPGKKHHRGRSGASASKKAVPVRKVSMGSVLKAALFGALLGAGVLGALNTPNVMERVSNQRVERVIIEGEIKFISKQAVLSAVNSFISESLLLVDMVEIKRELESMPWIRAVTIRREWPDTMVLSVTEEKAIARWGETQLLNQDGAIFSPDSIVGLEQLAVLTGPRDSARQVMEQYQLFSQLLYQRGLKIAELELNKRGAWQLILTNGVQVNIGNSDVLTRVRRLVAFLDPFFMEQLVSVEAIDLRYMSGIAVKNKSITGEEVVSL